MYVKAERKYNGPSVLITGLQQQVKCFLHTTLRKMCLMKTQTSFHANTSLWASTGPKRPVFHECSTSLMPLRRL